MRRTTFLSAALLIVASCGGSPTTPVAQPPPIPAPPAPAPAPPGLVDLRGDYTLTFEVGGGCEEVPKELRTRTYEATVAYSYSFGSSDWFTAYLSGAKFYDGQSPASIEVTGTSLFLDLLDNAIVEQPSPDSYLATVGAGLASVQPTELSTVSGSFSGWFRYCTATSGASGANQCSVVTMTQDMCKAENSRWTLTRR
jgi:hypothetical protein